MDYTRDVVGRITESNYNTGSEVKKYAFSSNSDSPNVLKDNVGAIVERYITLPGIRMKKDSSTETLSIYSSTGNLLATESSSIHRYDPFGSQINQTSTDEGFGASAQREYEKHFSIEVIQMGARIYVPTLGRFLQVDPVEGGNANDYIYPHNPISGSDFSGRIAEYALALSGLEAIVAEALVIPPVALAVVGLVALGGIAVFLYQHVKWGYEKMPQDIHNVVTALEVLNATVNKVKSVATGLVILAGASLLAGGFIDPCGPTPLNKVARATTEIMNWLGEGVEIKPNPNGDLVLLSADGYRLFRTDNLLGFKNEPVHLHLEEWSDEFDDWVDATDKHWILPCNE